MPQPLRVLIVEDSADDAELLVHELRRGGIYFVPGELPTRWLNIATAISIQEMRPHQ